MRVFINVNQFVATLTDSAFALIGPDVGYAGICAQTEICAPKLCIRRMCLYCVSLYCYSVFKYLLDGFQNPMLTSFREHFRTEFS